MPTMIPSFLLKKLYVTGSFKNNPDGFELVLRNTLAPGTLIGFGPLKIDGQDVPLENVFITIGNEAPFRASELSPTMSLMFPLSTGVKFRVQGQQLSPGKHRVNLAVNTKEAGELKIDAEDSIQ